MLLVLTMASIKRNSMAKIKIGQKVEATITRNGGGTMKIVGEVIGFETNFGRDDVIIGGGTAEEFVVNQKSVKVVKDTQES